MIQKTFVLPLFAAALALAASPVLAQGPSEPPAEAGMTVEAFEKSLQWKTGTVALDGGIATLNIPRGYRYLGPADANRVLTQAWGNPPGEAPLGMIFPASASPLADDSWGVVVTFAEDGYVSDEDAADIDYAALLKEMQAATVEENKARTQAGYPSVDIVRWATTPRYDAAAHKLFWAEEIRFGGEPEHTLNYRIRALGRRGVLELNAVGSMGQLSAIERDMQAVLGFVSFNEGHRYADYVEGDKVAAYGIAALVAGKVAAKAGFFKLLLAGLLAAKKFLVIAVVAVFAFLRRLYTGKKSDEEAPRPKPAAW